MLTLAFCVSKKFPPKFHFFLIIEHTVGDDDGSHLVTNRISFTLSSAGCFDPKKAFRQTTRQTIEVCENLFEIE